jgi:hypothetical protein
MTKNTKKTQVASQVAASFAQRPAAPASARTATRAFASDTASPCGSCVPCAFFAD